MVVLLCIVHIVNLFKHVWRFRQVKLERNLQGDGTERIILTLIGSEEVGDV